MYALEAPGRVVTEQDEVTALRLADAHLAQRLINNGDRTQWPMRRETRGAQGAARPVRCSA